MTYLKTALTLTWICLLASTAHADCGTAHGKKDPHHMGRIASTQFQDLDTDKNGGISFKEFKTAFPKTSENGFKMLDKDGNNSLNESEWQAFKDAHKGMGSYTPPAPQPT